MKETIGDRLWDLLVQNGFAIDGPLSRYNISNQHYSEIVEPFFQNLVKAGEISHYIYDSEDISITNYYGYGCIAFSWFDGETMDMIIYETED